MSVIYEKLENNITKSYSDKGHMIRGGFPEGLYSVAYDPTDAGRTYVETDEYIPTSEDTPDGFRVFSKFNLESELFKKGVLSIVDEFIDSQNITNEFGQILPLRRFYNTALIFSESNKLFSQFKDAIKELLKWTNEQVEEVLSASVVK